MSTIPHAGRLALVLLAFALALPAQAQERFFQACVASAGADLPPGVSADALCGCAAQRTLQGGTAPGDLDALVEYIGPDDTLDEAAVPERLQPAVAAASEALMGCVLQVGFAGMMEAAMTEAVAAAPAAVAAAPPGAPAASQGGVPAELMAQVPSAGGAPGGAAAPGAPAPTVSPDGTVASAPTSAASRAAPTGFRTGAGVPARRATQASKGAAIRILE